MREVDAGMCEDCMGLVAASRMVEPHENVRVTRLARGMAFGCKKCGTLWQRGVLGWATIPDEPA